MSLAWFNGALVPAEDVRVSPADRGFLLGDGLFETVRVAGEPRHLARHLRRLRTSATELGFLLVYDDATVAAAAREVVQSHGSRAGSLRITLTRGPSPRGLALPTSPTPTLLMVAHLGGAALMGPASVVVATRTRRNAFSPLSRHKTLNYLDSIIARQEAQERGADDALLLNTSDRVAEASASNLILRHGSGLLTPPMSEGALPGIMRGILVEQFNIVEAPISRSMLAEADALFVCNSLSIRGIGQLDGAPRHVDTRLLTELARAGGFP